MKTINASKIVAAALIAASLSGMATAALADEYVTRENKEQIAVSASQAANGTELPAVAAAMGFPHSAQGVAHQAPHNTTAQHLQGSGPFSDTDAHSGPAYSG